MTRWKTHPIPSRVKLLPGDDEILNLWGNTTLTQQEISARCGASKSRIYSTVARGRVLRDPRAIDWQSRGSCSLTNRVNQARSGEPSEISPKRKEFMETRRKIAHREIVGRLHPTSIEDLKRLTMLAIDEGHQIKRLPPGDAWGRYGWTVLDALGW